MAYGWTETEEAQLAELYADPALKIADIERMTGRNKSQIIRAAKRLGLTLASSERWPESDAAFVRQNVEFYGASWCAEKLGRTHKAVRLKAERMGLSPADERDNLWLPHEDDYVLDARAKGVTYKSIGADLGRTPEAVRYRYKVLRGVI